MSEVTMGAVLAESLGVRYERIVTRSCRERRRYLEWH